MAETVAHDGAHLLGAGLASTVGCCTVCGEQLGCRQWWVTTYPHGEHTECRDWTQVPFPFDHQLRVLRRLWSAAEQPAVKRYVADLGVRLVQLQRRWPGSAADVADGFRLLRQARAALLVAGMAPKLCGQL